MVREGGAIKAFGAGILSSYGELEWMANGGAELAPLDPYAPQPKMRCAFGGCYAGAPFEPAERTCVAGRLQRALRRGVLPFCVH